MIPLRDWNSYLKNIYESLDVIDNIQTLYTKEYFFSLEDIEIRDKRLTKGKNKDIEGYQA